MAKKKKARKKSKKRGKLTGAAKAAFLARMAKGRKKTGRKKASRKKAKPSPSVRTPPTLATPKKRRKTSRKKRGIGLASGPTMGSYERKRSKKVRAVEVLTADDILRPKKPRRGQSIVAYVCAGPRYSGCGGGKRGSHVVGHLRT